MYFFVVLNPMHYSVVFQTEEIDVDKQDLLLYKLILGSVRLSMVLGLRLCI